MATGFQIENGVLLKYDGAEAVVSIPDGVETIDKSAFYGNKTVTEVIMPDSVCSVGEDAFAECIKLKTVRFSGKLERIENSAFRKCKALTEAVLPETLSYIGFSAFAGCAKLKVISCKSENIQVGGNPFDGFGDAACKLLYDKNGMLIFADALFDYIGEAEDVEVPYGVKRIMSRAFAVSGWGTTSKLKSITLPETVVEVGNFAFASCRMLKKYSAPAAITYGLGAFADCKSLADENGFLILDNTVMGYFGDRESVTVPDGVHTLGDRLFEVGLGRNPGNGKISEITLPASLKKIGAQVFCGCEALTSIKIPNGVTQIGENAFNGCCGLVSADIPDSVAEIGDGAFKNCTRLKEINLPGSVTKLGFGLFAGCTSLVGANGFLIQNNTVFAYYGGERHIVIPEGIECIDNAAFEKTGIMTVQLPSTLKVLGAAFTECEFLEKVIVPEGVEVIRNSTFSGCIRLSEVVLPSTLVQIGNSAFCGCEALRALELPQNVRRIGHSAFENCTALEEISLPSGVSALEHQTFLGCSRLKTVKLPRDLEVIGGRAFEGCRALERVEIPDRVSRIEYSAFQSCIALKKVEVSDVSKVAIDATAFGDCPALADENGLTILGDILWFYSGAGGDVTVPEGVTQIAANVFREGSEVGRRSWKSYRKEGSLHSVSLPGTLKSICAGAFAGCTKLSKIDLPENLETIGESAFYGCKRLSGIEIPDSVTGIGHHAFAACEALTNVSLGAGVTEIPFRMVAECSKLKTFHITRNIKVIDGDAFVSCDSLSGFTVDAENPYFSQLDGILFNKDATRLIFCPCGKKRTEYTVPDFVTAIATHAFLDCYALKKVVIPESVAVIGAEVFPRRLLAPGGKLKLTDIEVSPGAGAKQIGSDVFDFPYGDGPLTYPKLPVTFVREAAVQLRLGMGFCLHPEKFEGEYAEIYKKYVTSHEKTIVRKAKQLKLTEVEAYYAASEPGDAGTKAVFKPDVSAKKLSDLAKVELLEETVRKGKLEDVKLVLDTYKPFEMTARALAIAARYKGLAFVKELVNAGATFRYESSPALRRKYKTNQDTAGGSYSTEYYLMLVPEKIDFKVDKWGGSKYAYTPLCGVPAMNIPDEMEDHVLSLEERVEIAKFCSEKKKLGASLDEMLFWALTRCELAFADLLLGYGADLNRTAPTYYTTWGSPGTYMDIITSGSSSVYWNEYVYRLTQLKAAEVAPVLERLNKLAIAANKKLAISRKLFEEMNWNDKSLAFALKELDCSKVNQKKALELAVDKNFIASLEMMAQAGWLSATAKRESLIEYARANGKREAQAWLLDFKNRTVDVQAEAAKEEARMIRELMEDPNSVSALKKVWGYKKLENGTLIITSYKGDAVDVEVPAVIGKAAVTVIGADAFSAWDSRCKNQAERKKIRSITIPEGVVEVQKSAFWSLDELEKLTLPSTVKRIGTPMVGDCGKLKEVTIPKGAALSGDSSVFLRCGKMFDRNGWIIIDGRLYTHIEHDGKRFGIKHDIGHVEIPENVTEIAPCVFREGRMSSLALPDGLKVIGENAFEECAVLRELEIPGSVERIRSGAFSRCFDLKTVRLQSGVAEIGAEAFASCRDLHDIYIPKSVRKLGKEILGPYDSNKNAWEKVRGIVVHTQEGSPVVEYMKKYSGVYVAFDYEE